MRILGIDCGTATTGWAAIEEAVKNQKIETLGYGVIRTDSEWDMGKRLDKLYKELVKIIKKFNPDCVAIESLFYFKNQKTVISVGQARGVSMLAAAHLKIAIFDYSPLQVKQAVTGYGRASKGQIQKMVKNILNLKKIPKPDDAADALAIAICHLNTNKTI